MLATTGPSTLRSTSSSTPAAWNVCETARQRATVAAAVAPAVAWNERAGRAVVWVSARHKPVSSCEVRIGMLAV